MTEYKVNSMSEIELNEREKYIAEIRAQRAKTNWMFTDHTGILYANEKKILKRLERHYKRLIDEFEFNDSFKKIRLSSKEE